MAKVGIVMGSDSDMPIMAKAADVLEELGIDYEMTIISAHREPDVFFNYAKTAEEKGFKVIIAGAGMAAHLPGMCAAIFPMPVIGIPMHTTSLGGRDSLYSMVEQMQEFLQQRFLQHQMISCWRSLRLTHRNLRRAFRLRMPDFRK